jgi:hypothetical protein
MTNTATPTMTSTATPTATPTEAVTALIISAPASVSAGATFGVTVTALNQWGSTATTYRGTVHFTCTDGSASLPVNYTFTSGDAGVHFFPSVVLQTAGTQRLTATDTVQSLITGYADINVGGGAATSFTIAAPAQVWAGQSFSVSVTARDQWNNIATNYLGTIFFTSTDPAATLPADYTYVGGDQGVHLFIVTLRNAGIRTITATDTVTPSITGTSNNILVRASLIDHFEVTAPANANAGAPFTIQVTAKDLYNNTVTNYYGTVTFTSSDAAAALPANYTYQVSDNGARLFTLTLNTGSRPEPTSGSGRETRLPTPLPVRRR